ncbi:MAG: FAD/NAD(P)-binding protein [Candidatus Eisenbacteria bacterium]
MIERSQNPYLPYPVRIDEIITETGDHSLKTFKLVFLDPEDEGRFSFLPGQFAEISVAGKGEVPIGIASSPTEKGYLLFTVQKMGVVTEHLHRMKPGDRLGLRGPLGNWYPWDTMAGKNVIIIGGGCAFSTLRSSIVYISDPAQRSRFKAVTVVYGARCLDLLLYNDRLDEWKGAGSDIDMHVTVDAMAGDEPHRPRWECHVGFVPAVVKEKITDPTDAIVIICGPPAMLKYTMPVLKAAGFADEQIYLSLENRMKCGIGMCGRCNVGGKLVCKDGPVFTLAELGELPREI